MVSLIYAHYLAKQLKLMKLYLDCIFTYQLNILTLARQLKKLGGINNKQSKIAKNEKQFVKNRRKIEKLKEKEGTLNNAEGSGPKSCLI